MALFTTLKTGAVAAGLSLAMAVAGFAAPAQAAGSITLNFGTPGYGFGYGTPGFKLHFGDNGYFDYCLDDDGIYARLASKGYKKIHIIRQNHDDDWNNKVWVVAQNYKGDWYQMRVDRCSHAVDKVRLVYKASNPKPFNYNNFSFSFSF